MAGDWIKIECSTPDKPEVLRIARICGVDKDIAFSKLVRVWIWFDTVSVDGVVDACVDADIDMLASLSGLANAMRSVGWLDSDSDASGNQINIKMPNFDTHTSESAKKRALKNKRQARWRKNVDAYVDADVDDHLDSKASTREEKRREENKKTLSSDDDGGRTVEKIPYDSVFETYENVLCVYPYNRPRVKVRDDKRKSAIKKIWAKSDKTRTIDWWREYFEAATGNEHWMRGDKHKGGTWDGANFDFLLRDDVFKRIVEGAV